MKLGAERTTGMKATVAVAMSNYIEAGSIIAIAVSLTLWQEEFGVDDFAVGLLAAVQRQRVRRRRRRDHRRLAVRPARAQVHLHLRPAGLHGRRAAGGVRGQLRDAAGRLRRDRPGGGAGVPASWTYIAEEAPAEQRAKHVGTAQLAWSIGPMVGFALAILVVPLGLLGSRLIFAHLFVVAFVTWWLRQGLAESAIWTESRSDEAGQQARVGRRTRTAVATRTT